MRKPIVTLFAIAMVMLFAVPGCEEVFLAGAGGAGTVAALHDWEQRLETQSGELEAEYGAVLTELDRAPDPNAIAGLVAKLKAVRDTQMVSEGTLIGVQAMLELPTASSEEGGRTGVAVTAGISALLLAAREFGRHQLANKYKSMKLGKARFTAKDPEAGAALHEVVGVVREELSI